MTVGRPREHWRPGVYAALLWLRISIPWRITVITRARAGDWSVVLVGHEPVPRDWFPADLAGAAVLCLASGGGQQGPVLAAAGAVVTVFDNSPRQLVAMRKWPPGRAWPSALCSATCAT